jgi:hypothetical protein
MKEGLWLKSLLSEIFGPFNSPITMFSDNQAAIALTCDHQYHAQTKHIDMRYHWIRWVVEEGAMCLVYCPTDDMVADALTKALPSPKVKHFAACLGLRAKRGGVSSAALSSARIRVCARAAAFASLTDPIAR